MKKSRIIRQSETRQQKILKAQKQPRMNRWGLTPKQIRKAFDNKPENVEKKETLQIKKKDRPEKASRDTNKIWNKGLLLQTPNVSILNATQYPTPDWFTSTEKADVSVVVPLYKSVDVLEDLITQWDLYNSGLKVEIIYVDDNCPMNSKAKVIELWQNMKEKLKGPVGKIYHTAVNQGFGATCNVGAYHATGDNIIFLNADTIVTKDWIRPITRLLKREDVGVVGNLQIKKNGKWDEYIDGAGSEWHWKDMVFHHIGRHSYNLKIIASPFHPKNCPKDILDHPKEVEMVTGCCLAIKKDLFEKIGGFDPNYRIGYWEDSELCLIVRELGYKAMYTPHSKIYHKLGHTGSGQHKHQTHNKSYFMNKWVNTGRIDPLVKQKRDNIPSVKSILIKRETANGDVLAATAVAAALKKKHPGCKIWFNSGHPNIIEGNPHIDGFIEDIEINERKFDIYYNLDMAYEYRPKINIIEAYCQIVGVKQEDCEFFLKATPIHDLPKDFIAIHAGYKTSWAGRDWPARKFEILAKRLLEKGHNVVCLGATHDYEVPCTLDLRGKTNANQLAYVTQAAKLFVGVDSFPMHVAQFTDTPGVCFFGSIDPKTRIYRNSMKGIVAEGLKCLGCHHRKPVPCTFTGFCETQFSDCINKVSVDDMMEAIQNSFTSTIKENNGRS